MSRFRCHPGPARSRGRIMGPEAVWWAQEQPPEKLRLCTLVPGTRERHLIWKTILRGGR